MTALWLARLDIETAKERLPGTVHRVSGDGRGGGPQPQRPGAAVAGQVIDGQPDEGALDDRQLAVVILPTGTAGQPLVQLTPGRGPGGAVPGRLGDGGYRRGEPGLFPGEPERGPVPDRPA